MIDRDSGGDAEDPTLTGVAVLSWIDPAGTYEAALAFRLPASLAADIRRARRQWGVQAPAEFQLEPHLTLIYLGWMNGTQLLDLWQTLRQFEAAAADITLGPPERLSRDGTAQNLCASVTPSPALLALHDAILRTCRDRYPWFTPGVFVGPGYHPHITVLAEADPTGTECANPGPPLPPTWPVGATLTLRRPVLFCKALAGRTPSPP
ncbi:2'-5' RNA ligase family protein [Azospirillum sp. B506]|uniref:2'-5' RNA ligase family protein n=1 Tax=Azospirillum sp. B506 TaxID=137721 RepID=UPI0003468CA5|nr:2'-5' RNA ligase family protein [Azospirillum sp. B506]